MKPRKGQKIWRRMWRKCAYCGKRGNLSEMTALPVGKVYRSESHFAHVKCAFKKAGS